MKISFGIVNYNRLFYLKSCAESLMESVKDYDDELEFICIDDNSKEKGTQEYLQTLKDRGWTIINQEETRSKEKKDIGKIKDVIDEFSAALNLFHQTASGEYIVPLQGDTQFIRKGWLNEYVDFLDSRDDVFVVMLDAQRKVRLENEQYEKHKMSNSIFAIQKHKVIPGAGDCFYNKECLDTMGGWKVDGNINAEDLFSTMGNAHFHGRKKVFVPWFPASVAIFTDPRGTQGRVRGNVRYGLYWEALKDNLYYQWVDKKDFVFHDHRPFSIEEIAIANGDWELPIDECGNWKKNPINWPIGTENVSYEIIS